MMNWKTSLVRVSVEHPRLVIGLSALFVSLCALAGVLKGVSEHWNIVDTDPENMLSPSAQVRRFHNRTKKEFSLHDMIVLGIANESDPDGVFNPQTLSRIQTLTDYIKGIPGVISGDLIAPSDVDVVEQAGPGTIKFERLMEKPPATRMEAQRISMMGKNQPILYGTLLSEDAKALCLYVPIREKKLSHKISQLIRARAEQLGMRQMDSSTLRSADRRGDQFGITGLPVAEDTFGVEMFIQMGISAPLAMVIILLILLYFFRKLSLVISPMIVGIASVISCMGLLIGLGNTVHIMSSMIPIFVLPIAVEDSVHILSQFYERYRKYGDPGKTIIAVMEELFTPMLYTSLTTMAGFASLALTPIPPVRTFGIFVALGVAFAWFFTVTFIPAYATLIPKRKLRTFGAVDTGKGHAHHAFLSRRLDAMGAFTYRRAKLIVGVTAAIIAFSVYGISRLKVNDNPTKWFGPGHPIRVADQVLNSHFGGTYLAYLVLEPETKFTETPEQLEKGLAQALAGAAKSPDSGNYRELLARFAEEARKESGGAGSAAEYIDKMIDWAEEQEDAAPPEDFSEWEAVLKYLSEERARADVFKRPEMLRYVDRLDDLMTGSRVVGKTNSAAVMVKQINKELKSGTPADYAIPGNARMIAECYIQAQSGHRPQDLWHLITPDYNKVNIWVQLKSGDNRDMERVVRAVNAFMKDNPPPVPLKHRWAGLTYVNVEWQNKMVSGMLRSLLGSFVTVFIMMVFLFHSILWGILCMIPLSVTIAMIYAIIGLVGKDYDMPVAVLSALTLGLAIDFAIHYLSRVRELFKKFKDWRAAAGEVAGETARAIARNVVVITLGFMPLLAAPLVPYQTVGFFMAAIMCVSGIGTLVILPALITVMQGALFKDRKGREKKL